jgi:hypothetical protein
LGDFFIPGNFIIFVLQNQRDMENIKFIDGKVSDPQNRGYIMYRKYADGVYVMMGSYTDNIHRGKGVFKDCFDKLLNEMKSGEILQAAACSKILAKYLQEKLI